MRRSIRLLLLCVTVAVAATLVPATGAQAKGCDVGNQRSYGTTYVLSIRVSGTSCRAGKRVVRAFHACRPGKSGKCRRRVLGYRCSERRFDKIRTQYSSRVSCRKGGKRVKHTYTQFT
jgi:hypothetical protein